jgi:carbon-monoxide dehydrogenase medium subunit
MKAAAFEYLRPKSVAEASVALGRKGMTTAAIAGGQSLVPMLNLRVAPIDLLVDISRLDDLKALAKTPDGVWIGALTTHAAIEDGKAPDIFGGLMRRVAGQISYRAVRNHGTIGGSVALADPAADWPCCLIALDATVRVAGRNGVRVQSVAEFVRGPYETTLVNGDIIMGFDIPSPAAPFRWGFAKVARKSRPLPMQNVVNSLPGGSEADLRAAIATDLALHALDLDAYQARLHTATILRAIRDMKVQ